jgi:putative two-component system hydrogenase maturation factor HypX/HoxX
MSKITLLVTTFNSISQAVYVWLRDRGYAVDVVYANSSTKYEEIDTFKPDLILCPYLKDYVSSRIYEAYDTFVFHPGIRGDRGAYSLEWALWNDKESWGGVWLRVVEELDGGDIYASGEFVLRDSYKASIYRNEELQVAVYSLKNLLENIESDSYQPQLPKPMHPKFETTINWQKDTTKTIIKKINTLDSFPGVLDEILGVECYLFGAHYESKLRGNKPKEILAKRDGAICISTIDGALWISHLKQPHRFKLPATYVLKSKLQGIKEHRLPLIFDKSYDTFYEISCDIVGDVAYLYFDFHNGAFSSDKCIKLKYAFEYIKEKAKVIVLMGGEDFFSNGIHLNILEDSKKDGEDGWGNINAMNDLVGAVLMADDVLCVASLSKNAGAGGVFLALACDYVVASNLCVLNPHYKTLGLSGSEYHTFTLPKRVGEQNAKRLLDECLPISSHKAKELGMVDEVFESKNYQEKLQEFVKSLIEDEDRYDDMLWDKQDYIEANKSKMNECKQNELATMHPEFWDESSIFHKLRYEFVYKICPTKTPKRLKFGYNAE